MTSTDHTPTTPPQQVPERPAPDRPDPTVVALGRAVERVVRRIGELDGNVRQLATDVHTLAGRLTGPPAATVDETEGEGPPAVRSWLLATDPEQAAADLADLVEWLGAVYLRYPDTALSSCWLWHPDVIEELWWLRCAHADAYHPDTGSWLRAGDWHDRQRPGVTRRVRAVLGKCDLSRHAPQHGRPAAVAVPGSVPLAAHAAAIATTWTTPTDPSTPRAAGPVPTAQQLTEADAHHAEQYRNRR